MGYYFLVNTTYPHPSSIKSQRTTKNKKMRTKTITTIPLLFFHFRSSSSFEIPRHFLTTTYTRMKATISTSSDEEKDSKPKNPLLDLELISSKPVILGSGSFTRKLILKEMNLPFHLMVRPIDEKGLGDRDGDPTELVTLLAKAKADHLIEGIMKYNYNSDDEVSSDNTEEKSALTLPSPGADKEGWIVLTGDQVVTHDGKILEKPESIEEAKVFVKGYSSSPPKTVGSCVLTHIPSGVQVYGVDTAQINFKASVAESSEDGSMDLIDALLKDGAPVLSCAGGLMVEHPLVKKHISGIDGTEDSVMGLSKALVLDLLQELKEKLDN